jgi:hypothetical protein
LNSWQLAFSGSILRNPKKEVLARKVNKIKEDFMPLFSKKVAIIIAGVGLCLSAAHVDAADIKLQTNPKLLVSYPYFSIKFVPTTASTTERILKNNANNTDTNTHALANPSTDSKPFSLSEIAYYEVITGGHGFALLRNPTLRMI